MSAVYSPDNPGMTTLLGVGVPPPSAPPAGPLTLFYSADVAQTYGVQREDGVKHHLKSKIMRRKELRPPQGACTENYTGLLDAMPLDMDHGTRRIIDYATPIVIEPQTERETGRMDRIFNKGQYSMCSQYTDFNSTFSQSPSPSLPRDSGLYEGYQDSGMAYGVLTPPPALYPAGALQGGSSVEQLNNSGIKCEESPTLGTVTTVESPPIVIQPVVDDMVQMKQAYGRAHTAPSTTPSHMTTVPPGCLNAHNGCYQTPPPLHQWPGPAGYFGHTGHIALGTLTPYYPVSFNHIPPANYKRYPLLSEKIRNPGTWRDVEQRQARPGHPYLPPPPPPVQHITPPQPLVIQPLSMNLQNIPCQIPSEACYKAEDDDRAVMMRCYAKKETKKETSVNISGTCHLQGTVTHEMQCKGLWSTENVAMVVENQVVEFDVNERILSVIQKTGPHSEEELIDQHYRSLEKQLPRYVKACINSLTDKAAKHEGGIFFDNDVNNDLVLIEQACAKLSVFNHKLVYEHLSQHLPCSKETLRRHAETLALAAVHRKLRNLMESLFHRLEKEMPYQIERHLWECSVATKLQFQQQAMIVQSPTKGRPGIAPTTDCHEHSSSKPVDQHHIPEQSFLWTEVTRQLIWDILKTKLATYPNKKTAKAKTATFERLTRFVQRRVVSAWPEGWMDTETVLEETRRVQKDLRGTSDLLHS